MRCSSLFVGIIISLLGTLFDLVDAIIEHGYLCDREYIPVDKLQEAVSAAKVTATDEMRSRNLYEGLPFTKAYTLWPVSPGIDSYEPDNGPYRVVLTKNFEVFSVVIKSEIGIRECELLDDTDPFHVPYSFYCDDKMFRFEKLKEAAEKACPKIRRIPDQSFPVRYDGYHFQQNGLQRYMFPVFPTEEIWQEDMSNINFFFLLDWSERVELISCKDPGTFRVIMNSECSIVGVIKTFNSLSRACSHFGIRHKLNQNYWKVAPKSRGT